MSRFSAAQRDEILDQSRELLRRTAHIGGQQHREVEIIYKRRDDALVDHAPSERSTSAGSELSWAEWVDQRIAACLEPLYESVGTAMGEYVGQQVAALKRQIELLEREIVQLREQFAIERGLRDLRSEVEAARAEVPKLPAIMGRFEKEQEGLRREVEKQKARLNRARADQSMTDYRLSELQKSAKARATEIEMKLETASFTMREVHPNAKAALRDFAAETFNKRETLWRFDPGPAADAA
jgi:chromosome segregation ATPase